MNETILQNYLTTINWSDVVNILLTIILIIVTYFQVIQANRQTTLSKLQRIDDEFKEVIEPLYSNIDSDYYFLDRPPSNRNNSLNSRYWIFWETIQYNKYLCPKYLRDEIESALKYFPANNTHGFDEITDELEKKKTLTDFEKIKQSLFNAVRIRYRELHLEKERLMEKLNR